MPLYDLILFDLDGTLVDSAPDVIASELYAFRQVGLDHLDEQWIGGHLGAPLEEVVAAALGSPPPAELLDRFVACYREHHYGRVYPGSRLFPGVQDVLRRLRADHLLAVATTRPTEAARHLLDHFELTEVFHMVQGTEPQQRHKPDPEILNLVIAALGADRRRTLMVGDTSRDVMAGQAAGVDTALIVHGQTSAPGRALDPQPDWRLEGMLPLLELVRRCAGATDLSDVVRGGQAGLTSPRAGSSPSGARTGDTSRRSAGR